ncbi:hypothetical protein [Streptomyces sp. CT34]|uniref:hypothetical protein n=1 Tax=Streptomyces sp. CT34 TaxID=1553907 RepID=UPI0005B87D78|nr:hypothetical protein [Streptomyces sp. CT34]
MPENGVDFLDPRWRRRWRQALRESTELAHIGRWCHLGLVLGSPAGTRALRLERARIVEDAELPGPDWPERLELYGSQRAWAAFLAPVPPPFHNDLPALDRRQEDFEVRSGREVMVRHLRSPQLVFECARQVGRGV